MAIHEEIKTATNNVFLESGKITVITGSSSECRTEFLLRSLVGEVKQNPITTQRAKRVVLITPYDDDVIGRWFDRLIGHEVTYGPNFFRSWFRMHGYTLVCSQGVGIGVESGKFVTELEESMWREPHHIVAIADPDIMFLYDQGDSVSLVTSMRNLVQEQGGHCLLTLPTRGPESTTTSTTAKSGMRDNTLPVMAVADLSLHTTPTPDSESISMDVRIDKCRTDAPVDKSQHFQISDAPVPRQ